MKIHRFISMVFVLLLFACNGDDDSVDTGLTEFQQETIRYFNEVALGVEFGQFREITRKWKEPMKVYFNPEIPDELEDELSKVKDEINALVTDGFVIEFVPDSADCNFYVFLGTSERYTSYFPEALGVAVGQRSTSYLYFNQRAELVGGHMFVDLSNASLVAQKHMIREELTQSIGLARHSDRFSESIFYEPGGDAVTTYAEIDAELVRLLYHPNMVAGVDEPGCTVILQNILTEENFD